MNTVPSMSAALFEAVCEHAEVLGMDPVADRELLWIAERSLNASLPEGWHSELDETHQTPYYFSDESEVPQWEHPRDEEFRALFVRRKAQGPPFDPDDGPVASASEPTGATTSLANGGGGGDDDEDENGEPADAVGGETPAPKQAQPLAPAPAPAPAAAPALEPAPVAAPAPAPETVAAPEPASAPAPAPAPSSDDSDDGMFDATSHSALSALLSNKCAAASTRAPSTAAAPPPATAAPTPAPAASAAVSDDALRALRAAGDAAVAEARAADLQITELLGFFLETLKIQKREQTNSRVARHPKYYCFNRPISNYNMTNQFQNLTLND